jgi:hypothetical protein
MILLLQTVYSPREHDVARNEGHVLAGLKVGDYTGKRKAVPSAAKARLRDDRLFAFSRWSSGVPALHAAAFGGPVRKALKLVAVFPRQLKKFPGGHVSPFFAKKRLKPPL